MLYYAQKVTQAAEQPLEEDLETTPAILHADQEDAQYTQGPSGSNDQHVTDTEEEEGEDYADQPTLAEILKAIHKCTASVDMPKEHFGELKEKVGLIRHDLQKEQQWKAA